VASNRPRIQLEVLTTTESGASGSAQNKLSVRETSWEAMGNISSPRHY